MTAAYYKHGRMPAVVESSRRPIHYTPGGPGEFTEMQRRFCQEYIIDLDGPAAAIRAGYAPSRANAASNAMLKHPPVRDHVARLKGERSARTAVNADRVLRTMGEMFFGDPVDLLNEHGGLKLPHEMKPADRMMIQGIKIKRQIGIGEDGKKIPEEIIEIKLASKETLGSLLMRHLGMLNDKVTVEHTSLADRLRAAQLRQQGIDTGGAPTIEGEIVTDDDALFYEPAYNADIEAVVELTPELQAALNEVMGD